MHRMPGIGAQSILIVVFGYKNYVVGRWAPVTVPADFDAVQSRNTTGQPAQPSHCLANVIRVSQPKHHHMCNHSDRLVRT